MVVKVKLLVPYNRIADAQNLSLEIQGDSLDILVKALIEKYPALERHFKGDEVPGAAPFLLVINDKVVPVGKPSDIILQEGDVVAFTRVLGGG